MVAEEKKKPESRDTLPGAIHEEHVTLNIETRCGILRKVTEQTHARFVEI